MAKKKSSKPTAHQRPPANRVLKQHCERRKTISRKLAKVECRQGLKEWLEEALEQLENDPFALLSSSLMSISQRLHREFGIVCFEPRTEQFEGPIGGKWLRRQDTSLCAKQIPWSEWSSNGYLPEPVCPSVVYVDPMTGSSGIALIQVRDDGTVDDTYATNAVKRCIKKWLKHIAATTETAHASKLTALAKEMSLIAAKVAKKEKIADGNSKGERHPPKPKAPKPGRQPNVPTGLSSDAEDALYDAWKEWDGKGRIPGFQKACHPDMTLEAVRAAIEHARDRKRKDKAKGR